MDNPAEIIKVKNLSFSYDGLLALQDINLSIYAGDFLAIIGPNGSGKTTLLKLIVGLLKPEKGQIFLFGQPLEEFRDWHKIGYIQQKGTYFDLFIPISVEEVIAASLYSNQEHFIRNKKEAKERIVQALKLVGLDNISHKKVTSLSGGQQQRILIARALVNDPEVLLLDEPTTGVDYLTQESFYDLLGQLNKARGITIVLITHDYGIVNKHVNRVACLNQKLVYHGEHSEFCQSDVVQQFLSGGHHLVSHRH